MLSVDCDAACRHTLVDRSEGAHTDGKGCTLLQAVGRQVGRPCMRPMPVMEHEPTITVADAHYLRACCAGDSTH